MPREAGDATDIVARGRMLRWIREGAELEAGEKQGR